MSDAFLVMRRLQVGESVVEIVVKSVADEEEGKLCAMAESQRFGEAMGFTVEQVPGLTFREVIAQLGIVGISHAVRKVPVHSELVVARPKVELS